MSPSIVRAERKMQVQAKLEAESIKNKNSRNS